MLKGNSAIRTTVLKGHNAMRATVRKGHSARRATVLKENSAITATVRKGHSDRRATMPKDHSAKRAKYKNTRVIRVTVLNGRGPEEPKAARGREPKESQIDKLKKHFKTKHEGVKCNSNCTWPANP